MTTRVLAFDVYNTLARWPADGVRAGEVQDLLADYGVEISYLAYEAARQGVFLLDAPRRRLTGWTDFFALLFARLEAKVSLDLLTSLSAMHESRSAMELFPDVVEAIEAAKASGLTTCAFTTLPRFMLGPEASCLGRLLAPYFDCGEVGMAKGDRRFYRRITDRLGVDAGEILCVGDDPIGDCRLPTEAGWRAVLLDREGKRRTDPYGQIATISTLAELDRHYP